MAQTEIEKKFLQYSDSITVELTDEKSMLEKGRKTIEQQFDRFALTNEQIAPIVSEVYLTSIKSTNQQIISGALELIKLEKDNELKDAQIALAKIDLKIKGKELEIKTVELEIKYAELEAKKLEVDLTKEKINETKAKTCLITEQCASERAKQVDLAQSAALKGKQALSEIQNTKLIAAQSGLVRRQEAGYGDNMLVKAAEFEGGLASFAINSAPENPSTSEIIAKFNSTISSLKGRS